MSNEKFMAEAGEMMVEKGKLLAKLADAEMEVLRTHRKISEINANLLKTDAFRTGHLSVNDAMAWR